MKLSLPGFLGVAFGVKMEAMQTAVVGRVQISIEKLTSSCCNHDAAFADLRGIAEEMEASETFSSDEYLQDDPFNTDIRQIGGSCWSHSGARVIQAYISAQFGETISVRNLLPFIDDVHQTLVDLALGCDEREKSAVGHSAVYFFARVGPVLGALLMIFARDKHQREVGRDWMENQGLLQLVRRSTAKNLVDFTEKFNPPYVLSESFQIDGRFSHWKSEVYHATVLYKQVEGSKWLAVNTWENGNNRAWGQRGAEHSKICEVDISAEGLDFKYGVSEDHRELIGLAHIGSGIDNEALKFAVTVGLFDNPQECKRVIEKFELGDDIYADVLEQVVNRNYLDASVLQAYQNLDIDVISHDNTTDFSFLHFAAAKGNLSKCAWLIDHGANPSLRSRHADHAYPLDYALLTYKELTTKADSREYERDHGINMDDNGFRQQQYWAVVELLVKKMQPLEVLESLVRAFHKEPKEFFSKCDILRLDELSDVNLIHTGGCSILHKAAAGANPKSCKNLFTRNTENDYPSFFTGQPLCEVDPGLLSVHGATPLHYAAGNGRFQNCMMLLDLGVNPFLRDHRGRTALDLAEKYKLNAVGHDKLRGTNCIRNLRARMVFFLKYILQGTCKVFNEFYQTDKVPDNHQLGQVSAFMLLEVGVLQHILNEVKSTQMVLLEANISDHILNEVQSTQ